MLLLLLLLSRRLGLGVCMLRLGLRSLRRRLRQTLARGTRGRILSAIPEAVDSVALKQRRIEAPHPELVRCPATMLQTDRLLVLGVVISLRDIRRIARALGKGGRRRTRRKARFGVFTALVLLEMVVALFVKRAIVIVIIVISVFVAVVVTIRIAFREEIRRRSGRTEMTL